MVVKTKTFGKQLNHLLLIKVPYAIKIVLNENDELVTDQKQISDIFNEFYINVANNIGDSTVKLDSTHESITKIDNLKVSNTLNFSNIDKHFVDKQIRSMDTKRATGNDNISVKMLKQAQSCLTH